MERLDALLDLAATALIAGDFDALSRLTPEIESLDLAEIDRPTAYALMAKAKRNQCLLDAATRGVKTASLRVSDIIRGPTLTTYDAHGQKAHLNALANTQPRRV